jgi:enamine deaminase RidA (YjgF/YER057c/UK114 family)
MARQRTFSGTVWEATAGYCRAMRVGHQIFVSGTAPSDDEGGTFAPGDAYAQTMRCFDIIQTALEALGGDLRDVIRTRIFITDMEVWEDIAKAHHELFAEHPPVNTMVEVARLVNPDMLVEVEVEAICAEEADSVYRPRLKSHILGRPVQPSRYSPANSYPPTNTGELDEGCLD